MAPVSSSSSTAAAFAVAVQKKLNDTVEEQGKAALELIEAAAPAKAPSGPVGTQLHLVG